MYCYAMGRHQVSAAERARGRALGRSLAQRRREIGSSGNDVSVATGISVDAIRSIESGRVANPGFFLVATLSEHMEMSLDALARGLSGEAPPPRPSPRRGRGTDGDTPNKEPDKGSGNG